MTLLTTQINNIFNKIFYWIIRILDIVMEFIENIFFKILVGHSSSYVVIDEFMPLYDVINNNAFCKNNNTVWWYKYYNFFEKLKPNIQKNEPEILKPNKDNINNGIKAPEQTNNTHLFQLCKNNNCIICSNDPLFLKYPCNTLHGKISLIPFTKEHTKINKLSESILFEHRGGYKFMFTKYECDNYSNLIVMRIFSRRIKPQNFHIKIALNSLLSTLDYNNNMIFSAEINDKKKSTAWWEPSYIFGTIDVKIFNNFVDNVCKNISETSEICEEFREHENYKNLNISGSKLTNINGDDLQINSPVIINDYKTFSKLQKRLNVGYRLYYNNLVLLQTTETWQVIIFAVDDFTVSIVVTHNRAGIIISKIGTVVTQNDIKYILMKILNLYEKSCKDYKAVIYKFKDISKGWDQNVLSKRTFDSIYLPSKLKNNIREILDTFIACENNYIKLGITYKLGLLFYGPPGTGKTSMVKAIATDYNMSIYVMDLNNSGINDETISNILNSLPHTDKYKILLFEDVDNAFTDKEQVKNEIKSSINCISEDTKNNNLNCSDNEENNTSKTKTIVEDKHLTYSGLLNAFDGVISNQNKVIMIMTTNYKDKLGSALIRPGRIDYAFCIDYCNIEQIIEMVTKFLSVLVDEELDNEYHEKIYNFASDVIRMCDELNKTLDIVKGITTAKLQSYIMKYASNPDSLFNNYIELFAED